MQFDYANAHGKLGGGWQQPTWLSLRAVSDKFGGLL